MYDVTGTSSLLHPGLYAFAGATKGGTNGGAFYQLVYYGGTAAATTLAGAGAFDVQSTNNSGVTATILFNVYNGVSVTWNMGVSGCVTGTCIAACPMS
jgi:hypothetical protein